MRKHRILLYCLLCNVLLLCAQTDSSLTKLKSFVQNINTFNSVLPQEKVYLHFDNTSYFLGEHIWFKAYVVNPTQNRATTMSRVLYVELLNQQGFILQTRKLKIDDNGQCHGDFALTDSMFAGFYEVRAYTRYMLNFEIEEKWKLMGFDEKMVTAHFSRARKWVTTASTPVLTDYYTNKTLFTRVFPVYDKPLLPGVYNDKQITSRSWIPTKPFEQILTPSFYYYGFWYKEYYREFNRNAFPAAIPATPKLSVTFYPEGGSLVQGITSCVAFKAVDETFKDLNVSGYIQDSKGKEVTSFKTQFRGMGLFYITPTDTMTYFAHIIFNNQAYRFELPTSLSSGIAMRVNNLTSTKSLFVEVDQANCQTNELLGLSVMCRGRVVWFDTLRVSQSVHSISLNIPKSNLPTGVNQLTLFNGQGSIVAERLCFVNNDDYGHNVLTSNYIGETAKPNAPINLAFKLTNQNQQPSKSTFSVSVREESTTEGTFNTDNILTNLLLSSELNGYIPDPEYYFLSNDYSHKVALDLLLLTQGWRRYKWKTMAGVDSFKLKENPEKSLSVEGLLTQFNRNKNSNLLNGSSLTVYYASFIRVGDKFKSFDNEWIKMIRDAKIKLVMAVNDSMALASEQQTMHGKFKFKLPDFLGERNILIEMSDTSPASSPNKIKKAGIFKPIRNYIEQTTESMVAHIYHFPVLPKDYFTYYETTPPPISLSQSQGDRISESLQSGSVLSEVTIRSNKHAKNSNELPDFSKPDLVLTGRDVQEMASDRSRCEVTYLPEVLKASISDVLHLYVENLDLYIVWPETGDTSHMMKGALLAKYNLIPNEFCIKLLFAPYLIENISSVKIYIAKRPRVPFQYNFPSAYILIDMKPNAYPRDAKNTRSVNVQGYSYLSDFYHPDYSKGVPPEAKDYRRTLYWNPNVQTDSTGKATVSFYNNNNCKELDISAEGITKDGVPFVLH